MVAKSFLEQVLDQIVLVSKHMILFKSLTLELCLSLEIATLNCCCEIGYFELVSIVTNHFCFVNNSTFSIFQKPKLPFLEALHEESHQESVCNEQQAINQFVYRQLSASILQVSPYQVLETIPCFAP